MAEQDMCHDTHGGAHADAAHHPEHAAATARRARRDEFLRRVARRADIPLEQAEARTRGMLSLLRRTLSEPEWGEVCRRVPESLAAGGGAGGGAERARRAGAGGD